jgi:uncharacterized membrane protein
MAGIGFELRRLLQRETFGAWASAYLLGGVIVLGPFLCAVASFAGVSALAPRFADLPLRQAFTAATVYAFAGSLVATGMLQVVLTRYLADLVYRGDSDRLIQCLFPSLTLTFGVAVVLALPVLLTLGLPPLVTVALWLLYVTIAMLWTVLLFVTAAEGHRAVVRAFFVGAAVSLGAAVGGLAWFGLAGALAGYTIGYFLTLLQLARHLIAAHGFPTAWDWGMLSYFGRFPSLLVIGLLTNLGIWVDKLVFWSSELAVSAAGLTTAPKYDSATFLGFLTALPAMTHFFVRIEADFAERFHRYFDEVFFKSPFADIQGAATALRQGVRAALFDILKVQGVVTLLAAWFGTGLLHAAGLPVSEVGMFRFAVVGSLFFSFLMFSNVILLYLDRRREVLGVVVVFFVANATLTLLTRQLGYPFYGLGLAAACLLALALSLFFLLDQLHNLEFRTFSAIPVLNQRRATSALRAPTGHYGHYQPLEEPPS